MGWVGFVWSFQSEGHGGLCDIHKFVEVCETLCHRVSSTFPRFFFIYTCTFYIHFRQRFETTSSSLHQLPEVTENWCPCCCHCLVYQSWIWASTIWNIWLYQERREEQKHLKDGRSWCWCRDGDVVCFCWECFLWKKTCQLGLFSKKSLNIKVVPSKKKFAHHRIFFPDNHPLPLITRTQEASKHTDTATNEMIPNSKDVMYTSKITKKATLRILTPQNWLFWGPDPCYCRFKLFH